MAKRKGAKPIAAEAADAANEELQQQEWLKGYLSAAYVLDVVGMLHPETKAKLDSLAYPGQASWDHAIEQEYGINRTFVRSVYALCTEIRSPADGVVFILQGIGAPDIVEHLSALLPE